MTLVHRLTEAGRAWLPRGARRKLRQLQHAVIGRRDNAGLAGAKASFGAEAYDEAAATVAQVLTRTPDNVAALDLAAKIAGKRGEFTAASKHAVRRAELTQDLAHWDYARKLVGRVRETDPRWQPALTADPPGQPTGRSVLYLAKESRPFLHNGFCTRTHESLQALTRLGREVRGVTMPGFPGVLGIDDAPDRSEVEEVTYHHLLPHAGKQLANLAYDEYVELTARALAGAVAQHRPGLLHIASGHRGYEGALAGNAVARWAGIPWLYEVRSFFETTWTDDQRYNESAEYYHRRFDTESRMMRAAGLVLTLSGPMRDEIVHTHGIDEGKVRVVPNAVDLSRFTPRERDEELRRKLGLTGTFTLGYVSNLSHPREGQEVLIEAVAKLKAQGRKVSALIVGDGSRRAELESLARRRGVRDSAVFTGNVPFDEVAGHYAQIDLFVVPRVDERAARMVSPMKPFEAMAMRVPLLMADLPALAEIVGANERGHTFRAGDAGDLAAEAAKLQDSQPEREKLIEAAATWVAKERSWSAVAEAFAKAYDDLLDTAC
jgi:glycosyltransferase involved in cell wall biosynthesis